jgi:outer membrane murein-binding lipoprotein Lpp
MATSVGLNFRLTAAVDKFEAGMKDVEKTLKQVDKDSQRSAKGLDRLEAEMKDVSDKFKTLESGGKETTAEMKRFASQMQKLEARLDKLEAGSKDTAAKMKSLETEVKGVGGQLKSIEKNAMMAAKSLSFLTKLEVGKLLYAAFSKALSVIKSVSTATVNFAKQASSVADAIGKLSAATGVAVEPLQVFQKVAEYNGISGDKLGEALKRMTKRLSEAKMGFGEALPALERLGLNVTDLANMKPEQAFLKIGSAIGQLPQKGDQAAAAFKIFSDQGLAMVPMFADMEKNVKATAKEMTSLGLVLSGTQIKNIETMNDRFKDVYDTGKKLAAQVLANFAPAITQANEKLLEFVKTFQYQGLTGGQAFVQAASDTLKKVVLALSGAFDYFLNTLAGIAKGIASTVSNMTGALAVIAPLLPGVGAEDTVGLTNLSLKADHVATQLGKFESNVRGAVASAIEFAEGVQGSGNEASEALGGFFDSLKTIKGADIAAAFGNVKDAAAAVAARLPTFDDAVGATSQALQTLREPAPFVRDAMNMLGRGFDNTLTKLGFSRDSLIKFAEKVTYAQSITGRFADAAGGFTDLLHSALNDSGSYIVKGANSAAQALMDILQPLGWTKDAVEAFGAQLNAHKNFKQQLIDNAMSDWDSVAKQRLQYYINQGANPFAAFHAMYGERQKMLEGITAEVDAAEKAWIKATGGLTGQMDITAEGVKLAGEEITKKLAAAGDAAKEGIEKATGFIKDLFGFGEGADVPSLDIPDPTEELEKQTPILERIGNAAENFGANFVLASF